MADDGSLQVELTAVEVSNLRGFRHARLTLREGLVLLVGPNNSGKTSVLRILDWVLNTADDEVLSGTRPLTEDEYALLVPARKTGGAARRITLYMEIPDGRRRRRFQPVGEVVQLRIGVNAQGQVRLNVGKPRRSEPADDGTAMDLLLAVRRCTEYGLVPATRDAGSTSFNAAFRDAVTARLEERAIHARRAGAPAEYRQVKKALDDLEQVATKLVSPLWDEMVRALPPGLARRGELRASISPEVFIPWLVGQVDLRLVTGDHDIDTVAPIEVGSGLQSLLELATQQAAATTTGGSRILAIEEPEAFLHPSAQRTLARLIARDLPGKRIVSTHSPLLVEEASYGDVVLVRDHQFYEPAHASVDDAGRAAINTALQAGHGAELAFARSALLVEGDGDRLYFEWLRRRVAAKSGDGRVDQMYVLPTGGKTQFGPWLRLLASYGREGARPVAWLAAPDSDAATEIRRAWEDAQIPLSSSALGALNALSAVPRANRADVLSSSRTTNGVLRGEGVGISLLPIDLEYVMLDGASPATVKKLCHLLGAPDMGRDDLEVWLGNNKYPWMRAVIARETPWAETSPEAKEVLKRWMEGVMPAADAAKLVARA